MLMFEADKRKDSKRIIDKSDRKKAKKFRDLRKNKRDKWESIQ